MRTSFTPQNYKSQFDPLVITDPKILEHTQDMSEYLIEKSGWNKYTTSDYAVHILLNEKNVRKDKEEARLKAEREEREEKRRVLQEKLPSRHELMRKGLPEITVQ